MSDDFKSTERITVRAGDSGVPYTFEFPICSSASANDGMIPFGLTITSATVASHTAAGVDSTASLIVTSALATTLITVDLKYPTVTGVHHIVFTLILSDATKKDYVFERVDVV